LEEVLGRDGAATAARVDQRRDQSGGEIDPGVGGEGGEAPVAFAFADHVFFASQAGTGGTLPAPLPPKYGVGVRVNGGAPVSQSRVAPRCRARRANLRPANFCNFGQPRRLGEGLRADADKRCEEICPVVPPKARISTRRPSRNASMTEYLGLFYLSLGFSTD
jgi:hypothetical protein